MEGGTSSEEKTQPCWKCHWGQRRGGSQETKVRMLWLCEWEWGLGFQSRRRWRGAREWGSLKSWLSAPLRIDWGGAAPEGDEAGADDSRGSAQLLRVWIKGAQKSQRWLGGVRTSSWEDCVWLIWRSRCLVLKSTFLSSSEFAHLAYFVLLLDISSYFKTPSWHELCFLHSLVIFHCATRWLLYYVG